MKKAGLILAAMVLTFMVSCKNGNKKTKNENMASDSISNEMDTAGAKAEKNNITLTKMSDFPTYEDVTLKLDSPKSDEIETGKVNFKFDVENMSIGDQTENADDIGLANSDKGQHIHFIIDDKPYMAFYEDDFEKDLNEGTHILVAFPARSYHMSVKNKNAFVAKKLTVGQPDSDQFKEVDLSAPTLIYSRPKGTYKGEDTHKVLLDFYLLNTSLASNGNKVKATIDGQEFTLDDWAPYVMEGLPMGKNTITLELVDQNGNAIDGSFNKVERSFTLE